MFDTNETPIHGPRGLFRPLLSFATLRIAHGLVLLGDEISWEAALLDTYTVSLLLATIRYLLGNEE